MKRTVLVVEDDPSIGVFILERDGYSVHWESLGQAAERYIHAPASPQSVVLDMNVSGIDGYGLLARIRDHAPWRCTPVLMLTALSQSKNVAVAGGANDYLLKPFHPDELTRRLSRLIANPDVSLTAGVT